MINSKDGDDGWARRLFDGSGLDGPLAEAIIQVRGSR